jgi:molybdopterin/thiamine biosynthesis adenylyltransferase/rhodanese-related sulfurtransferase
MDLEFTSAERSRYARHLILPEFGLEGQQRLKAARVLVVGAGGLGSPMLLYLAAAGVGTIGIVDFDRVEDSNLQRQVLFGTGDIGQSKAQAAKARILDLNPHIAVQVYEEALTVENALQLISDYDVVADGTDNFQTRYLVNDACVLLGKVNVYASIFRFDGQVSVFNGLLADGSRGPNYRDLYPTPPPPGTVPSCAEGGVLGVLPGIVGTLQASEVIKVCAGIGEPLIGRLLLLEALEMQFRTLKIRKDPTNPISGERPTQTGLIDYDQFCGLPPAGTAPSINVQTLRQWREEGKPYQLIDVREPSEYAVNDMGGHFIPLGEVLMRQSEIVHDRAVVVHCRSGKRSQAAIAQLQATHPDWTHLYNLEGGILAWEAVFGTEKAV